MRSGQGEAAGVVLDAARTAAAVHQDRWWLPELYRLDAQRQPGPAGTGPAAPRRRPGRAAGQPRAGRPGRQRPGRTPGQRRNGARTVRRTRRCLRSWQYQADQVACPMARGSHDHDSTDALFDTLQAEMRGPVIQPADAGYDAARAVYNAMIDRQARRDRPLRRRSGRHDRGQVRGRQRADRRGARRRAQRGRPGGMGRRAGHRPVHNARRDR